ncbi:MAG TPA: acetyl-CoA carboxylase carboxyl transferase subunit alpha, partial [Blastocatellia bacterium]|nr:acetyl-CoA carboxylase carboxyl transferase subunit alpha [Blastocatellia bacterium]
EGGAHADHQRMAELLSESLEQSLDAVRHLSDKERVARRYEKFRKMGEFEDRADQTRSQNAD